MFTLAGCPANVYITLALTYIWNGFYTWSQSITFKSSYNWFATNNDKQQTKTSDKRQTTHNKQQTRANDKWQTKTNDKQQMTNNKQRQTPNKDKWQTTNDKLYTTTNNKKWQTTTNDNQWMLIMKADHLDTWTAWTTLTNWTTLTILTDQWLIKKIIAEFALFT